MDFNTPIVIGRSKNDFLDYKTKGAIYLGKKYHEIEEKLIAKNDVFLDISSAHVVFICGKRGGGKSYTMGVIAEGFDLLDEEIKNNLSIILLDTMGVYWSMKHPNNAIKRSELEEYNLSPKGIPVQIFTPEKYFYSYKEKGIPTDYPFTLEPNMLDHEDWCLAFKIEKFSDEGIMLGDITNALKEHKNKFSINEMIEEIKKHEDSEHGSKKRLISMLNVAKSWGVFSEKGTDFIDLAKPGKITVLDVSCYATMPGGLDIKALITGIVSKHLFIQRMAYRKNEEFHMIKKADSLTRNEIYHKEKKEEIPLIWLVIDEAHEFLPKDKDEINAATMPLVEIMREGRQPGISLILATQQPGKIHTDVMTQSDIVLSHRITAQIDVSALGLLSQSYNKDGIQRAMDFLPSDKGTAVVFDDLNEQIHQIKIRPRVSWHGGSSPNALRKV
jgi:uncharacterized protein